MKKFNEWIKDLKEDAYDGKHLYSGGKKYDSHGRSVSKEQETIIDFKKAMDLLDEIMNMEGVEYTKNDPRYSELHKIAADFNKVLHNSLRTAYKDWGLSRS